jgi:hypothetical protein
MKTKTKNLLVVVVILFMSSLCFMIKVGVLPSPLQYIITPQIQIQSENVTRLTMSPANDFQPMWSPDGEKIVYLC